MSKLSQIMWCIAVLSFPALGQEEDARLISGLSLVVNSEFSYDDNVLRQQGGDEILPEGEQEPQVTPQVESRVWVFNPRLLYRFERSGGDVSLS